ncbi:hybrid sensor histidine kinase/response regulator [Parvularcula marina]|uniref:histidine kinase n=1 Tax=Parvularcula marina TaxID=2292771 RepID=A0A371RHD2_9PROT|nr:ATP-binding protein [Parvularcula marina]RFB04866.1 response regulator [Parvularcula marina]
MTTATEKLRRIFNLRYAIAIALLAAAACASFGLNYRLSMMDTNRAIAFTLISAQQTDSQRIAFLITSIETSDDPVEIESYFEEMRMTISRMRSNHDILVGASSESARISRFIAPLHEIYMSGETPFDIRVRYFLEQASDISRLDYGTEEWAASAGMREEVITAAKDNILQTHALMSLILEAQAIRMNSVEKGMGIIAWLATLALIALITLLIFRPLVRHVLKAVTEMEDAQTVASEAEHAANEAKEAKGHFFQAASHELKTPLNAIVGMTDAIKEKGDLGLDVELEQIIAASDQLLNLLNNILDTHRLSDGHLALDERDFALREAVERPLKRIMSLAEAKGIDFKAHIEIDDDCIVEGDAQRLEQVITNLVDNAVKFTNEGEVTIDAKIIDDDEGPKTEFSLCVKDTGVGIPEEDLETIFEQAVVHTSMLSRNGGLGVGLALVRAIASSMGGSIDVTSVEGEGSTFTLSLPMKKSAESMKPKAEAAVSETSVEETEEDGDAVATTEAGEPTTEEKKEKAETLPAGGFDVLIVDDNMANRMVAEALVKPLGARTEMAADGRQAVDAANEKQFDLILMDISMPVMDGVKATQMIRQSDGPNRETPIIALTAHVGPGEWSGLGEVGFNDILNKPVRKEVIQRCAEKWVRRRDVETEKAA